MPIEIRELVVRMRVDQNPLSHSTYQKSSGISERELQEMKKRILESCREEIREMFEREKER